MVRKKREKSILYASVCVLLVFLCAVIYEMLSASFGMTFSESERNTIISLNGDYVLADSEDAVKVDDTTVVIRKAGTYKISGKLNDGRIIVEAGKDEKVTLKLQNVEIHCEDSAPLWVKSAKRVVIKMDKGSENTFSDGSLYASEPDGVKTPNACICSKANLTIKGKDAFLLVRGNYKNGLSCSKDIDVKSGSLDITAAKSAIRCNEVLSLWNGSLKLSAQEDGIYSKELVDLQKGSLQIDARRYGIFAHDAIKTSEGVQLSIKHARSDMVSIKEEEVQQ